MDQIMFYILLLPQHLHHFFLQLLQRMFHFLLINNNWVTALVKGGRQHS